MVLYIPLWAGQVLNSLAEHLSMFWYYQSLLFFTGNLWSHTCAYTCTCKMSSMCTCAYTCTCKMSSMCTCTCILYYIIIDALSQHNWVKISFILSLILSFKLDADFCRLVVLSCISLPVYKLSTFSFLLNAGKTYYSLWQSMVQLSASGFCFDPELRDLSRETTALWSTQRER